MFSCKYIKKNYLYCKLRIKKIHLEPFIHKNDTQLYVYAVFYNTTKTNLTKTLTLNPIRPGGLVVF